MHREVKKLKKYSHTHSYKNNLANIIIFKLRFLINFFEFSISGKIYFVCNTHLYKLQIKISINKQMVKYDYIFFI
jgi:hypothetical protein